MKKLITLLAALVVFPSLALAQGASSTQVKVNPGSVVQSGVGAAGVDSRRIMTLNGTPGTAFPSGTPSYSDCPAGKVWGEPYGVLLCLTPQERCEAQYLTWMSTDGKSICKAYAPASSAIKVTPLIKYLGVEVSSCPEGSSRTDCVETTRTTQSPPISLNATPQISIGVGTAAASCISGAWSLGTTSCTGGTSTALKPCAAGTVSWTSGTSSCSASAPAGVAGQSITLTDSTGPVTGTVNAICVNGEWGGLTGQKCASAIPDCPATTKAWGTYCSGELPQTPNGSSGTVADATGLYIGTATYSCVNGSWSLSPSSQSCAIHCTSQGGPWQWQKGAAICSGTLPVGRYPVGSSLTVTDSTMSGSDLATGTYSVTCKADGTWDQANQSINCSAYCPSSGSRETWSANGNVCTGDMPASPYPPGPLQIKNLSSEMNTGTFDITCNPDGVWNTASIVKKCYPPCPSVSNHSWSVGSSVGTAYCSADVTVPATKAGKTYTATDTTQPVTGSFVGQCQFDGTWSPTPVSQTCAATCSTDGSYIPWGNCSYRSTTPYAYIPQGSKATWEDSTKADGYTGTVVRTCGPDATFFKGSGDSESCDIVYCPAKSGSFDGNCYGSLSATPHGSSATGTNTAVGYSGSATFSCSGGNWQYVSSSCNIKYCPAVSGNFGANNACYGSLSATPHGGSASTGNSTVGYTGSATYYCYDGEWKHSSSSCNIIYCPGFTAAEVTWGPSPSGKVCSASSGPVPHGSSGYIQNQTPGATGGISYYCNAGQWVPSNITCN